jgi:hypothetical protein
MSEEQKDDEAAKERLKEVFVRKIIQDPDFLDELRRRIEEDEIVD